MEAALLSEATGLRTIICNAIRTGNNSRIELLLTSTASQIVNQCLNSEMSDTIPLVIAARYGRLEIVRTLLKMGADPRVVGVVKFDGETIAGTPPLWAAAAAGYLEVVRVLVEEGQADINQPTSTNSTPLRGACYDGHLEIVKYLIEKGADLEIANRHGHTSLMIAAFRNKYEVVKVLLKAGANVSAKTLKGNTALHDAAEGGNLDIVRLLLDAEATLQPDEIGLCPLLTSAICGHEAIVEHLLPFCDSAIKKRDALKLLGCTLIDKKMDVFNGSNFWKRAFDIPVPYAEQDEFDKIIQSQEILPVYENLPEPHTQEEFSQFEHNLDFIRMLSLVIRERILGGAHPEVHYYLRFRGAIFCDLGQMDRCYDLWMRALHLQQINLEPLHIATISTLSSFQETFVIALDEHVINQEQISFVTTENIREIYDKICHELDRVYDWGDKPFQTECCEEGHDHSPETDTKRLFLIALQLFLLIYRLNSVRSATQTEQPKQVQAKKSDEETIRTSSIDLTRLINLAKKLHVHILHLALKEGDSTESSRFPNVHVIRGLLYAGADPEEWDESGSSPLHVLLRNKCNRASIAKLLLDYGCSLFARDTSDETIWELIWAKHPSTYSEIYIGRYIKLRGLAANAVMRNYNEETMRDLIPRDLGPFLSLH